MSTWFCGRLHPTESPPAIAQNIAVYRTGCCARNSKPHFAAPQTGYFRRFARICRVFSLTASRAAHFGIGTNSTRLLFWSAITAVPYTLSIAAAN